MRIIRFLSMLFFANRRRRRRAGLVYAIRTVSTILALVARIIWVQTVSAGGKLARRFIPALR